MRFKKLKYNIICLILILCVTAAVVIKVGFLDQSVPDSEVTLPSIDDEKVDNDFNNPDTPDTNVPKDDLDNSAAYEQSDNKIASLQRYPTKLLNYSLGKLGSASTYTTKAHFETDFEITAAGLSVYANQTIDVIGAKDNEKLYETMTYHADKTATDYAGSIAMNHIFTRYYDGETACSWLSPENTWEFGEGTVYQEYPSFADAKFYYDFLYPANINFDGKKGASISLAVSKNKTTKKTEYIVTVQLLDMKNYPEQFLRSYNTLTTQLNIKSVAQTIQFTIDGYSGWPIGFVKKDTFIGEHKRAPADIKMSLVYTQTISNINGIQNYTLPEKPAVEQ